MAGRLRAYKGDEPFVFVCYSHADSAAVYEEIESLSRAGLNIWYDEGIAPLAEWRQEIADAIERCALFIYYVSPMSVTSDNCRREVAFAEAEGSRMLAIYLEETELPGALRLSLSDRQAIEKHKLSGEEYLRKLSEVVTGRTRPVPVSTNPQKSRRPRRRWLTVTSCVALLIAGLVAVSLYIVAPPFTAFVEIDRSVTTVDDAELNTMVDRLRNGVRKRISGRQIWADLLQAETGRSLFPRMMAGYTLFTDVHASGANLILTAELHNNRNKQVVMTERHVAVRGQLFEQEQVLQQKFALLVVDALFAQLLVDVLPHLEPRWWFGEKAHAKELFIKASTEFSNQASGKSANAALQLDYLERLINVDPDFGAAYLLMASVYIGGAANFLDYETRVQRGTWVAEKGVTMQPTRSEAWIALGGVNLDLQLDYPAAQHHLEKARDMGFASGSPYLGIARIHLREGRVNEALVNARKASEVASVLDTGSIAFEYGKILMANGQFQDALAQYQRAIDLSSGEGSLTVAMLLGKSLCQRWLGDAEGAASSVDAAWSIWGRVEPELFIQFLAATGRETRARELIARQEALYDSGVYILVSNLFWGYYELGDFDAAFSWLQRSIVDRDLYVLDMFRSAVFLDELRQDPRFAEMEALLASLETRTDAPTELVVE